MLVIGRHSRRDEIRSADGQFPLEARFLDAPFKASGLWRYVLAAMQPGLAAAGGGGEAPGVGPGGGGEVTLLAGIVDEHAVTLGGEDRAAAERGKEEKPQRRESAAPAGAPPAPARPKPAPALPATLRVLVVRRRPASLCHLCAS